MDLSVKFKSDIHEHVEKRYKKIGDGNVENTMGIATANLLKSKQCIGNFELREHPQSKVGPFSTSVGTQSIAQLGKSNVKREIYQRIRRVHT